MAVLTCEQKQLSRLLIRTTTGFTVSFTQYNAINTKYKFIFAHDFFCSLVRRTSNSVSNLPSPTSGSIATWTSTTSTSHAPSKGQ